MSSFRMVRYGSLRYPANIPLHLVEVSGHFDISKRKMAVPYSLHTEYSYGPRSFSSAALDMYSDIPSAQRMGIPQLWTSLDWSRSFALFVARLVSGGLAPTVIEVHPPFTDCVASVPQFLDNYELFEDVMLQRFPGVQIVLENRMGTRYPGTFLVSTARDLMALAEAIEKRNLQMRVALDVPQLLHAQKARTTSEIEDSLQTILPMRSMIASIHMWGRRQGANGKYTSHTGSLDTWLPDPMEKEALLSSLHRLTDDDQIRWMVLEVNSGETDLCAILRDLKASAFCFV